MSHKVPIVRRPEYTIYLQEIEGTTWIHCDVTKWSANIARDLRRWADKLSEWQDGPIFALQDPQECQKHLKFLRLMGFMECGQIASKRGTERIFKR